MKKIKHWFIGELLAKTDDVFERAKIELVYNFSVFFMIMGLLFYGNVIANGIWYHFYIITFGILALSTIPFILKYKQSLRMAANWFAIQQTISSTVSVCIQEFTPDMSGPIWTLSFIIFAIFIFGVKDGIPKVIPFLGLLFLTVYFATNNIIVDLGVPEDQQLPNEPFVTIVPFSLCLYLIIVFVRTNSAAQKQIHQHKKVIEHNHKEITDSINYAKRIQKAVLPLDEHFQKVHPNSFILFKPKDIVSGDFYWFHQLNEHESILICADCTGHGVPGAFMTVVGCNLLNNIIIENKVVQPSEILKTLDSHISITLKQDIQTGNDVPDGMDLSLLKFDKSKNEFIFCSAKRPAFYFKNNELIELKANKYSLGGLHRENKLFIEQKFNFLTGEKIYLFTDGYPDQFGGPSNKKYMSKRLKETLISNIHLDSKSLKQVLNDTIENWKKPLNKNGGMLEYEQTDDIQVIGIHF